MADDPKTEPEPAKAIYVDLPGSRSDMLFDQLEFLLAVRVEHLQKNDCTCGDCLRFMRVYDILMEPFAEKTPVSTRSHQRKARKAVA